MGNYKSREEQLAVETKNLLAKFQNQTFVTKANLMAISNKLKELKQIDQDKWRNLANRIKTMSNDKIAKRKVEKFDRFSRFCEEFLEKV